MAITQISKIQIRRGTATATGFPQLASGELGWAIDTQELYIGNGSIDEGAPTIGNTQIITEHDLAVKFNLTTSEYVYKKDDLQFFGNGIVLQEHLDEIVSITSFCSTSSGNVVDWTKTFRYAISRLFLNASAPAYDETATARRKVLTIPAGTYDINDWIALPSYVCLVGEGSDKTVINYTGVGAAFRSVNNTFTSYTVDPAAIDSTNQTSRIVLSGMTIKTTVAGLRLDSVKHCEFNDITLVGSWDTSQDVIDTSIGINMTAKATLVTCSQNIFNNIKITGFSYGVYSDYNISDNKFNGGHIGVIGEVGDETIAYGIMLGYAADSSQYGQEYGPTKTLITNMSFYNITKQAIYIKFGSGNTITNCSLYSVGGGEDLPQIYIESDNNIVSNIISDRDGLRSESKTTKYTPTVGGHVTYSTPTYSFQVANDNDQKICRMPMNTDDSGWVTNKSITHTINYTFSGDGVSGDSYSRTGVLVVTTGYVNDKCSVAIDDDYDISGDTDDTDTFYSNMSFSVRLFDKVDSQIDIATDPGSVPTTIALFVTSIDSGILSYSYVTQM